MKSITILGATGSVGQSAIDLVARQPEAFQVEALTGGNNVGLLARDAIRLNAKMAVTAHEARLPELRALLAGTGIEVAAGRGALLEAADRPAEWVLSAIVGSAGLAPGLTALKRGGALALANKESMVCAGPLVRRLADEHGAALLPVDSEHSALFQALMGEKMDSVERVIITASGGAFRDWPLEKIASATPEQASTHPNWDMGQRITIDSASMFNKAMELIEAKELFDLPADRIEVLIHRESIVHAMVGHTDGAILAHMGTPDMRHAIGFALNWPERGPLPIERLDLAKIGSLTFTAPDPERYPALGIAERVMETGGYAGAVMNAAKEAALDAFLVRRISFLQMAEVVSRVLDRFESANGLSVTDWTLDNVLEADQIARNYAEEFFPAEARAGLE